MLTVNTIEDDKFVPKFSAEMICPNCPSLQVPVYCLGAKSEMNNLDSGEGHSLLDSLLLAQWEDCSWKGSFSYDITVTEIKVVCGTNKFLVQLNDQRNMDSVQNQEVHGRKGVHGREGTKHRDELLFCISCGDNACSEIVPSGAVPNGSVFIFANVNPIEYGHIILVPQDFTSIYEGLSARSMEMALRIAVEMNNSSFHLFYDSSGAADYHLYFQACYFPDLLPVEFMSVDSLFSDSLGRIHISAVADYPIKTLVFESTSTCNIKIMVDVFVDICACLLEKNISYNLLISDCGKRIFLFLQMQTLLTSNSLSTWECGGYFLFRSKSEFDQVTEGDLLKRLSNVSLEEEAFAAVKRICCSISRKHVTGT